jgi:prefoldin subunit 5
MMLFVQLKREIIFSFLSLISLSVISQTQTVRGKMIDAQAQYPLIGASIFVKDSLPIIGTVTDVDGNFVLTNVPVGRQSFVCQYLGYKTRFISNIVVTSGKEVVLEISLEESVESLNEFVVSVNSNKDRPNNDMA